MPCNTSSLGNNNDTDQWQYWQCNMQQCNIFVENLKLFKVNCRKDTIPYHIIISRMQIIVENYCCRP